MCYNLPIILPANIDVHISIPYVRCASVFVYNAWWMVLCVAWGSPQDVFVFSVPANIWPMVSNVSSSCNMAPRTLWWGRTFRIECEIVRWTAKTKANKQNSFPFFFSFFCKLRSQVLSTYRHKMSRDWELKFIVAFDVCYMTFSAFVKWVIEYFILLNWVWLSVTQIGERSSSTSVL